jgi:hypothetical protein
MTAAHARDPWVRRHALIVRLGIALNFVFVVPLLIAPAAIMTFFHLPAEVTLWVRFAALLLGLLSVFYVPATLDIDRYRVFAWLHVFPSRTAGAVFFAVAVVGFGHPPGFLVAVLLDGAIGLASLWCLLRIREAERAGG